MRALDDSGQNGKLPAHCAESFLYDYGRRCHHHRDGKAVTSAFAGEKVTVTAADKENAEFTGWIDPNGVLKPDQLKAKEVTFTMPGNNVTLTPNYKQYYTITSTDDVTIKVDNDRSTATAKALEGQHIVALANKKTATSLKIGKWTALR